MDGDTIILDMDGTEERVRLIGVDTPESVHPDDERNTPYGDVAAAFTKEALEGKRVTVELDVQERDRYGRLLAYVFIDGKMFNETLLSEGHALLATYPPNVRYVDEFTPLSEEARENGVGLWALYDDGTAWNLGEAEADTTGRNEGGAEVGVAGRNAAGAGSAAVAPRAAAGASPRVADGYIGNARTKKFHLPSCRYAAAIKEEHILRFAARADAIACGYEACKVCNP